MMLLLDLIELEEDWKMTNWNVRGSAFSMVTRQHIMHSSAGPNTITPHNYCFLAIDLIKMVTNSQSRTTKHRVKQMARPNAQSSLKILTMKIT